MALHAGLRHSRVICSVSGIIKSHPVSFKNNDLICSKRWYYENNNSSNNENTDNKYNWGHVFKLSAAAGLTAAAMKCAFQKNDLLAENQADIDTAQDIIDQENRWVNESY